MSNSKLILTPYQIELLSRTLSFYIEQFNHFLCESSLDDFNNQPFSYDNIVELHEYFSFISRINLNDSSGQTFLEITPSYLSHLD